MAMTINTIAGNLATVSEGNPNASAKFSSEVLLQGVSTLAVDATLKYSCSTAAEIMLAFVFYKEPNLLVHRSGKYTPVSAGTNAQITVTDTLTLPEELDALPDGSNFGVIIFAYIFSGTEQASVRVTNFTEYTNGEITKTLYKYSTPQVSGLSLRRCNADGTNNEEGTRVKFNFSGAVSPVGNQNTKELVIKYRESGAPTWAQETINITALGYNMSISDKVLSATFAQHKEYEIQAVLTDKLISTVNTKRVGTAFSLMHFSGDKTQIAFGKYCETGGPGMDVGLTARFRKGVQFDDPAAIREALGIYSGRTVLTNRVGSPTQYVEIPFGKTLPAVPSLVVASIGVSGGMTSTYHTIDVQSPYTTTGFTIKYNNNITGNTVTVWVDWIAIL